MSPKRWVSGIVGKQFTQTLVIMNKQYEHFYQLTSRLVSIISHKLRQKGFYQVSNKTAEDLALKAMADFLKKSQEGNIKKAKQYQKILKNLHKKGYQTQCMRILMRFSHYGVLHYINRNKTVPLSHIPPSWEPNTCLTYQENHRHLLSEIRYDLQTLLTPKELEFYEFHLLGIIQGWDAYDLLIGWNHQLDASRVITLKSYQKKLQRIRIKLNKDPKTRRRITAIIFPSTLLLTLSTAAMAQIPDRQQELIQAYVHGHLEDEGVVRLVEEMIDTFPEWQAYELELVKEMTQGLNPIGLSPQTCTQLQHLVDQWPAPKMPWFKKAMVAIKKMMATKVGIMMLFLIGTTILWTVLSEKNNDQKKPLGLPQVKNRPYPVYAAGGHQSSPATPSKDAINRIKPPLLPISQAHQSRLKLLKSVAEKHHFSGLAYHSLAEIRPLRFSHHLEETQEAGRNHLEIQEQTSDGSNLKSITIPPLPSSYTNSIVTHQAERLSILPLLPQSPSSNNQRWICHGVNANYIASSADDAIIWSEDPDNQVMYAEPCEHISK